MGIFSRFERGMEDGLEGAAGKLFNAPITPVQISKKAERAMHREKMVGAGKQYAPTLYTVLVNAQDDTRLFGYYPTLAGETETYLSAKAAEQGYLMDGQPLVRFIVDEGLRRGRFDVVAELVSAPIIAQLRQEEMRRYGLATRGSSRSNVATQSPVHNATYGQQRMQQNRYVQRQKPVQTIHPMDEEDMRPLPQPAAQSKPRRKAKKEPLPYVPEEEIDRSIDYGEYTFNSQDWDSYQKHGPSSMPLPSLEEDLPDFDEEESGFDLQRNAEPVAVPAPRAQHSQERTSLPKHGSGLGDLPFIVEEEEDEARNSLDLLPDLVQERQEARNSLDLLPDFDGDGERFTDGDISGIDVESYQPSIDTSYDFIEPDQLDAPVYAPDTAMFAAGAGQVSAVPAYDDVFARLVNPAGTRSIDLAAARLIIGRSSSCDIMIDDINASRNHAELQRDVNGDWIVNDLGSTNGTLVNGRRVASHRLYEGDHIRIGTTDFIFTLR